MKAILISTRPQWVEKILNGIKKDEIRKGTAIGKAINRLIKEQGVAPMLLYCTKDKKIFLRDFRDKKKWAAYWRFVAMGNDPSNVGELPPILNGKVLARFNATADLLELRMILGGLYFTRAEYECENCFDPKLNDFHENAQMDNWELLHYTGYKLGTQISDIHINDLKIFDKPKELSEFEHLHEHAKRGNSDCWVCHRYGKGCRTCSLTRAPQSWCYVEV